MVIAVNLKKILKKNRTMLKQMAVIFGIFLIAVLFALVSKLIPKTQFETENHATYIKETSQYQIKISYPKTHVPKLDRWIEEYRTNEMKEFLSTLNPKKKSFLWIDDTVYSYQSVKTILFSSNGYLSTIHYDEKNNQRLEASDYLKTDQKIQSELKKELGIQLSEVVNGMDQKIKKEKIEQRLKEMTHDEFHFVFHESAVTFFFGKEFLKELDEPLKVRFSYAKIWPWIHRTYVAKKDTPTKEQIESEKNPLKDMAGKKVVALTFDDGPGGTTTTSLLDGLKKRNVKVTFFQLGSRAERFPDIVFRAKKEGHEIGSHTYDHQNLRKLSDAGVASQISTTNKIIEGITKQPVTLLRPPYGSFDERVKNTSMRISMWSVDTLDWKLKNTELILESMKRDVKDGDVILMHDIYQTSVDAALQFIDIAKEQGFVFVTFSELAKIKGYELTSGKAYYSFPNQ